MAVAWPDLKTVRTLLRLQPDPIEDAIIDLARAAAIDYGNRKTNYQWSPDVDPSLWLTPLPDAAYEACLLHSARLYRRRDSIDGALGFGDAGMIRVGRADPDIDAGYALVGPLVFG